MMSWNAQPLEEKKAHGPSLFHCLRTGRACVRAFVRVLSITSQPLGQGERVHGGPVVGRVLRLLRGLLVQVVHGAQGVHGVQRVAVHPVVLHGERPLPAERSAHHEEERQGGEPAFN